MRSVGICLIALLPVAACTTTATTDMNSPDGNYTAGFPTEQAQNLGAGAWAGPPSGMTNAERAARSA